MRHKYSSTHHIGCDKEVKDMKLKVREVEVEGTPEELRSAGYTGLVFGGLQDASRETRSVTSGSNGRDPDVDRFSSDIERFLVMRVPDTVRATSEAIIREVSSWDGVRIVVGPGIPGGR